MTVSRRTRTILLLAAAVLVLGGCAALEDVLRELPGAIEIPGTGLPEPGDSAPEPGVFSVPGVVHRPTVTNPVRRISVDVPAGTYRVLELEMSVTHGGWSDRRPRGTHNVFWLARERNRDLLGYANVRHQGELFLRHGIGMRQGNKARVSRRVTWRPGSTLHFHYVYDTRNRRIGLTVRDAGRVVTTLQGTPNVGSITLGPGQRFLVDLGFTGRDNPNEPATLGWTYRDLVVRVR